MKRYMHVRYGDMSKMQEHSAGDYAHYSQVAAQLQLKDERIAVLETRLDKAARDLLEAKREVAQLRALVAFADARINHGLERRAHPRTVTVTTIDGNTREVASSPC